MSTIDFTRADLFAAATGSGTPLESKRRVATGKRSGLVGVGGLACELCGKHKRRRFYLTTDNKRVCGHCVGRRLGGRPT